MDESKAPGIRIEQIVMVRAAFEHRADFLALPIPQPLNLEVTIQVNSQVDEAGSKGIIVMTAATGVSHLGASPGRGLRKAKSSIATVAGGAWQVSVSGSQ